MINIVKKTLDDGQRRFISEIAALFHPWGWSVSSGRVYGYLLLHEEPVGLDRIAAELRMSKVGAWKAARSLASFGHVRRYGEPGSKRALYGATDNFSAPVVAQCVLLDELGNLLRHNAAMVARGNTTARLLTMARFYHSLGQTMRATIQELSAKKPVRRSAKRQAKR